MEDNKMKLINVEIKNFRLLEKITGSNSVEFNEGTTVLVGKNNSGKTSSSYIFDIFLNGKSFSFDDFSTGTYDVFKNVFDEYCSKKDNVEEFEDFLLKAKTKIPSIQLSIMVKYDENDDWNNIRPLLTSLDENNTIKIIFDYSVVNPQLFFEELIQCEKNKKRSESFIDCIKKIYIKHYVVKIKPFSPNENSELIKLLDINKIIGTCFIVAQRRVEDSNSQTNSKLSIVFQKQYKQSENRNKDVHLEDKEFNELNNALADANTKVDKKLKKFFQQFTTSFTTFGYPNVEGSDIELKSSIMPSNIFSSINLFYRDKEYLLPEKYNGLGYSNLIYIISEILNFKSHIEEKCTDLNLIFIEEPEAHMHPQLQNAFITKLNEFLQKNKINAQVIITTHSSHIVSNANFNSIRYFNRVEYHTQIKDLMKFKPLKDGNKIDNELIKFLKQYMTLVKCDMFFADKIILIEGVSERLLMPIFLQKVDASIKQINKKLGTKYKPISEQYVAVIEIGGAYMLKFKEFLEFLNVKTLLITDIDCCKKIRKRNKKGLLQIVQVAWQIKEDVIDELATTNETIINWMPKEKKIKALVNKKFEELVYGQVGITYQRNISDGADLKCGRTFEEAFIIDNSEYILKNKNKLGSIKNKLKIYKNKINILNDSYEIYKYIDSNNKKSEFAFDVMFIDQNNWKVPSYIEEGLLWLAK